MSSDQMRAIIGDFLNSRMGEADMVRLEWRDGEQRNWDGDEVKLLLNMVLLARDCLPRGGSVSVERLPAASCGLRITAQGVGMMTAESVKALHATDVSTLRPRGAQGFYTALLASRMSLSINYEDSHDRMVFVTIQKQKNEKGGAGF
ncbi:histidine phosphotransferase family protein [Telmatospirillum siberiense]|nr:histidine phosphotransferase family protein [Telmatospirillum siberiense]